MNPYTALVVAQALPGLFPVQRITPEERIAAAEAIIRERAIQRAAEDYKHLASLNRRPLNVVRTKDRRRKRGVRGNA